MPPPPAPGDILWTISPHLGTDDHPIWPVAVRVIEIASGDPVIVPTCACLTSANLPVRFWLEELHATEHAACLAYAEWWQARGVRMVGAAAKAFARADDARKRAAMARDREKAQAETTR